MTHETILRIFEDRGALLKGHFILTSGYHSPVYFQCAKILQYPSYARQLCHPIAEHYRSLNIQLVAAPAVGGIIVGHETAGALNCRFIFSERENQIMTFRRGFEVHKGERVLVVEDVVTTGGSLIEVATLCRQAGADVVGMACLVDRREKPEEMPAPFYALLQMAAEKYPPDQCPLCREGRIPAVKPGSRNLNAKTAQR